MIKGFRKVRREVGALTKRLTLATKKKPHPDAMYSAYGVWLAPNENDVTFRLYMAGSYGQYLVRLLKSQCMPFVFLDVGANQGLYSLLAAKNKHCEQVFAFEPVQATAALLDENIALNKSRNITVLNKGISDVSGTLQISFDETHSGKATFRGDIMPDVSAMSVEVMNADDLAPLLSSSSSPIIMKVDVEGYEATVLQEFLKLPFSDRIQIVFYECDERWVDPNEIRDLLAKNGFCSFEKVGEGDHYDVLARR